MKKLWIALGALALVAVLVAGSAFYTVREDQYACVFRFSEIVNTEDQAGL